MRSYSDLSVTSVLSSEEPCSSLELDIEVGSAVRVEGLEVGFGEELEELVEVGSAVPEGGVDDGFRGELGEGVEVGSDKVCEVDDVAFSTLPSFKSFTLGIPS